MQSAENMTKLNTIGFFKPEIKFIEKEEG